MVNKNKDMSQFYQNLTQLLSGRRIGDVSVALFLSRSLVGVTNIRLVSVGGPFSSGNSLENTHSKFPELLHPHMSSSKLHLPKNEFVLINTICHVG